MAMDFRDTPQEADFRAECRRFLDASAERKTGSFETWPARWGEAEGLRRAKEFQGKKAGAGLAAITWPKEYGGRGESPIMQVIYNQEEVNSVVPRGYFEIGLGMCIPTMMAYATEAQKTAFQEALLYAPGARIAGGTDEILKNILAERVLGLAADVRVDKDPPVRRPPHRTALTRRSWPATARTNLGSPRASLPCLLPAR